MSTKKLSFTMLSALSLAVLLNGCGASSKEGSVNLGEVARVGDVACIQCHTGKNIEALTGEDKVVQYTRSSPHNTADLGCEACHGGGAQHNGIGPIPFAIPDIARCKTCHNGTTAPLTSAQNHASSMHANPVGTHTGSCGRCHTHEGAVLASLNGVTGESNLFSAANTRGNTLTNLYTQWPGTYSTSFKCETCHEHGAGLRTVYALYSTAAGGRGSAKALWNPSAAGATEKKNNQFNLCTSCHNLYNYNNTKLIATGSPDTGGYAMQFHATNILRGVLVSTHKEKAMSGKISLPFANMTSAADGTNTRITGYVLRKVAPTGANTAADPTKKYYTDPSYNGPCFDCHGHEAKTNESLNLNAKVVSTIYTDWGQSGHAGKLLSAKIASNGGVATTGSAAQNAADKAINAYTDDAFMGGTSAWSHYNWDSTLKTDGTDDRGSCQMCHTATGFANYANNSTTYDAARNDFSHLLGWSQKIPAGALTGGSKRQNEILYCWGCHSNAGNGTMRASGQATLGYTLNNQPIIINNVGNSAACVICHGGRGSANEAAPLSATRSTRFNGHHAPTAGILFNEKAHTGYEFQGKDYTNKSFFAHDKIGANGAGPCASCHMASKSHSFAAVTENAGVITAINNQALCNTCHAAGGQYEMTPAKLDEEKAGYKEASDLLNKYVNNTVGFTNYLGFAINGTNYNNLTTVPDNAYGAYQNGKINGDEPCAYVHNRFYVKRLIFDSVDWMDNGVLDGTISIDATAFPKAAAWLGVSNGKASRP